LIKAYQNDINQVESLGVVISLFGYDNYLIKKNNILLNFYSLIY